MADRPLTDEERERCVWAVEDYAHKYGLALIVIENVKALAASDRANAEALAEVHAEYEAARHTLIRYDSDAADAAHGLAEATAQRDAARDAEIVRLRETLIDVRDACRDHVDADCVGDPPRYVGNAWAVLVNQLDAALARATPTR